MYKASSGTAAAAPHSGGTASGGGGSSGAIATPAKKPRLTAMSPSSASPAGRGGGKNPAGGVGSPGPAAGAAAGPGTGGGARATGGAGAAGMLVVKKADVEKGILVEVRRLVVVVVVVGVLFVLALLVGCWHFCWSAGLLLFSLPLRLLRPEGEPGRSNVR